MKLDIFKKTSLNFHDLNAKVMKVFNSNFSHKISKFLVWDLKNFNSNFPTKYMEIWNVNAELVWALK